MRSRTHIAPRSIASALTLLATSVAGRSVFAQNADGSAAAEGSGLQTPDLGTQEIVAATQSIAGAIEAQLAETAPWALNSFFGTAPWRWIMMAATAAIFIVLRRPLMRLLMSIVHKLTGMTKSDIDDRFVAALDPPLGWLVLSFGLYVALLWPEFGAAVQGFIDGLYRVTVIVIVAWALLRCVDILSDLLTDVAGKTDTELDDHLVPLVGRLMRFVVAALAIVIVLQEIGINVAGLIAGLGVGGLALALAAQDTVANWFGALMIYTDRPFETGDWIKTSEIEGVVEEVGLRSTRIRTFAKTVVTVPNRKLADATIDNFSRMPIRRVSFKFGVTYSTTPSMMRETLERMKDILRSHSGVDQTFWTVKFTEFGDSALTILVYFFTSTTDWETHLSIKESINLQFMDAIDGIGVQAAFPSRSIYLETSDPEELRKLDAQARELHAARRKSHDIHESRFAPSDDAASG